MHVKKTNCMNLAFLIYGPDEIVKLLWHQGQHLFCQSFFMKSPQPERAPTLDTSMLGQEGVDFLLASLHHKPYSCIVLHGDTQDGYCRPFVLRSDELHL